MNKNQYLDYYQHQISAPKKITNNYSNNIKTILVRSANRDKSKYPNKFDFVLDLETSLTDVVSLEIIKAYFNYNVPVVNSLNNKFSVYINLEDQTEINKDDAFIEIENIELGLMYATDTDKVIELFNKSIEKNLLPKVKRFITNLAYSDPTLDGIADLYIPKIFLDYSENIDRFIFYKLNNEYKVNTNYNELSKSHSNLDSNYKLTKESFGLFGIDSRIERIVNDVTVYNDNPDITWEDRWEEGKPRVIYETNPKNTFMRTLGFTPKFPYDCNKFLLDKLDLKIVHSELLGTNIKYEGFRFITRTGDEFLFKYEESQPRLFLINSKLSDNNIGILPVKWDNILSKFIDNRTMESNLGKSTFDVITIVDKIYHGSVLNYANGINGLLNGTLTEQLEYSFITPELFIKQLPIEIKLSKVAPPSDSVSHSPKPKYEPRNYDLKNLIYFDNDYIPISSGVWNNQFAVNFNTYGVLSIKTLNPYNSPYDSITELNDTVASIFKNHCFDGIITGSNTIDYLPKKPMNPSGDVDLFNAGNSYESEFSLNGKYITYFNHITNKNPLPLVSLEVNTNYQNYKLYRDIARSVTDSYIFNNETSLLHLISISSNAVYQEAKFSILKKDNEFLYNQIRDGIYSNNEKLGINLSFINSASELLNYTMDFSSNNNTQSIPINIDISGLTNIDSSDSDSFINVGALYVNMSNDNDKILSNVSNNSGYFGTNITKNNNLKLNITRNIGLQRYNITEESIDIVFSYFLNDINNQNDNIGIIDATSTKVFIPEVGVYYGLSETENIYYKTTNNNIDVYTNLLDTSKNIYFTPYKLDIINKGGELTESNYKNLFPKTNGTNTPFYKYFEFTTYSSNLDNIANSGNEIYRFDNSTVVPYNSYYKYGESNNYIYHDDNSDTFATYINDELEEFISNSSNINNYKYRNQQVFKFCKPFTNELLITGYTSAIISLNYFIADQSNCLYSPDYLILDIEELNNKYSNNNEIEKHMFIEIPNNGASLIYYESTNLGYSTKEFNPPLRSLNRLTIKVRDDKGNIIPDLNSSKDYTLIVNVQEINNSSSTSILNN